MTARSQLFHDLQQAFIHLLPRARVTRIRVLALFVTGVVLARSVNLLAVAGQLGAGRHGAGRLLSTERRLRRLLANPAVTSGTLWPPVLRDEEKSFFSGSRSPGCGEKSGSWVRFSVLTTRRITSTDCISRTWLWTAASSVEEFRSAADVSFRLMTSDRCGSMRTVAVAV